MGLRPRGLPTYAKKGSYFDVQKFVCPISKISYAQVVKSTVSPALLPLITRFIEYYLSEIYRKSEVDVLLRQYG